MALYEPSFIKISEHKSILKREIDNNTAKIVSIIRNEIQEMKTPGMMCFCDRCQELSNIIIKILKEK